MNYSVAVLLSESQVRKSIAQIEEFPAVFR